MADVARKNATYEDLVHTAHLDRVRKMPIFAEFGVPSLWMLDPANKALEVFRLESGRWVLRASFARDDKVAAEPFQEVEVDLAVLWGD